MTGKEGLRMSEWMLEGGANIVAGINPKKAGEIVHGKPIFATVQDACAFDPEISVTSIVVPAPFVFNAATEAMDAGIRFIHILTENVPVHDVVELKKRARESGAILLGPSSVGMLRFPGFRVGYLGGQRPFERLNEGAIALISASGGMTNEILMAFAREGIGLRIVLHLGGDRVNGVNMEESISWCSTLPDVRAFAVFVEPGNPFLRSLVKGEVHVEKPAAILLPGNALESMPRGLPFGHAGTIVGEDDVPLAQLRAAIRERGIMCTDSMSAYVNACKQL